MNKITLKTLSFATAQQVFDQVANHLLTQKIKSKGVKYCRYKTAEGLMCAAGCLIGDDEYDEKFETAGSWRSVVENGYVSNTHLYLITDLQDLHDNKIKWDLHEEDLITDIKSNLKTVANRFNLEMKF